MAENDSQGRGDRPARREGSAPRTGGSSRSSGTPRSGGTPRTGGGPRVEVPGPVEDQVEDPDPAGPSVQEADRASVAALDPEDRRVPTERRARVGQEARTGLSALAGPARGAPAAVRRAGLPLEEVLGAVVGRVGRRVRIGLAVLRLLGELRTLGARAVPDGPVRLSDPPVGLSDPVAPPGVDHVRPDRDAPGSPGRVEPGVVVVRGLATVVRIARVGQREQDRGPGARTPAAAAPAVRSEATGRIGRRPRTGLRAGIGRSVLRAGIAGIGRSVPRVVIAGIGRSVPRVVSARIARSAVIVHLAHPGVSAPTDHLDLAAHLARVALRDRLGLRDRPGPQARVGLSVPAALRERAVSVLLERDRRVREGKDVRPAIGRSVTADGRGLRGPTAQSVGIGRRGRTVEIGRTGRGSRTGQRFPRRSPARSSTGTSEPS